MSTAYFFSPKTLEHDPPPIQIEIGGTVIALGANFPTNALLTSQLHQVLVAAGALDAMQEVPPQPVDRQLLEVVHDPRYLETLHDACMSSSATFDVWSPLSPATWEAATLTCGATSNATRLVLDGEFQRAIINGRPAGHHAVRDEAMGACYLNDLACGAETARRNGADRVLIVDWDVHTGNGAEKIFWDRADVLALSLHQESWYPEASGSADMVGGPGAEGRTVNIPLPAATADAGYIAAIDRVVRPVALEYQPDLIIISAGQDPSFYDPQARMLVSMYGFGAIATKVREIADEVCEGRLVCSFQGGYSPHYAPLCGLAVVEGILGTNRTPDPVEGDTEWLVTQRPASEDVKNAIEGVLTAQAPFWNTLSNADPAGHTYAS